MTSQNALVNFTVLLRGRYVYNGLNFENFGKTNRNYLIYLRILNKKIDFRFLHAL